MKITHVLSIFLFTLFALSRPTTAATVRVATFNLYCFRVDDDGHVMNFADRIDRVAQIIVDQGIDVIGLQEVCAPLSGGESSLDILTRLVRQKSGDLRWSSRFTETHVAWGRYREGIGFLTRLETRDVEERRLGSLEGFFPRKALAATLTSALGPMRFIVTHLTAVWGDEGRRGEASRAAETQALKIFARATNSSADFTVAVGDFNSSPTDDPYRIMLSPTEGIEFHDAIPRVGGTIPSWSPGNRIDHIYVQGRARSEFGDRIFADAVNGQYLSDHIGVVTRLAEPIHPLAKTTPRTDY